MEREQKLKGFQKLALERIYRLFELAENSKEKELSKKYILLATKIGKKCTVRFPAELKQKFCKKCYSINITKTKEKTFCIITCNECKTKRKVKPLANHD